MQRVGPQLIQAELPQRDEKVIAPHTPQAGEGEPLEQPLKAPLRTPRRVAREAGLGPLPVSHERFVYPDGVVGGARAEGNLAGEDAVIVVATTSEISGQ